MVNFVGFSFSEKSSTFKNFLNAVRDTFRILSRPIIRVFTTFLVKKTKTFKEFEFFQTITNLLAGGG